MPAGYSRKSPRRQQTGCFSSVLRSGVREWDLDRPAPLEACQRAKSGRADSLQRLIEPGPHLAGQISDGSTKRARVDLERYAISGTGAKRGADGAFVRPGIKSPVGSVPKALDDVGVGEDFEPSGIGGSSQLVEVGDVGLACRTVEVGAVEHQHWPHQMERPN